MLDFSIMIAPEQMKKIASYEVTFDLLKDDTDLNEVRLVFPEKYRMTLEDLYSALKNILDKNPTVREFGENWYFPLMKLEDIFGIVEACRRDQGDDPRRPDADEKMAVADKVLDLSEEEVFSFVWIGLEDLWVSGDEVSRVGDFELMHDLLHEVAACIENKDKPLIERDYTDRLKEEYIGYFENDKIVRSASETELELCRRFVDELCESGNETALRIKGYSCQNDDRLYDFDWFAARDCMIRLFEKTGEPWYASSLAYIYYYGRCTEGVPEGDKAFELFSFAAANGVLGAVYKLGDLYRYGYGCKIDERTASSLYRICYDKSLKRLHDGEIVGDFADAAMRMGDTCMYGIGSRFDLESAYRYYLQADRIAKLRAERSNYFGYREVERRAENALAKAKELALTEDFFTEYYHPSEDHVFRDMIGDGNGAYVKLIRLKDDDFKIVVTRAPQFRLDGARPVLLTCPRLDYCELTVKAELFAYGVRTKYDQNSAGFSYDEVIWNDIERRLEFNKDGKRVFWLYCDKLRLRDKRKEIPSGQLLNMVSVSFGFRDMTYDYICDIPDVEVGDYVVVMTKNGETTVEVESVFSAYESELLLPFERYKRVLRKEEGPDE